MDNIIKTIYQSVGADKVKLDLELLYRIFEKFDTVSTSKIRQQIDDISFSLKVSKGQVENLANEFDTLLSQSKRKSTVFKIRAAFEQKQLDEETHKAQAWANAKVIELPIKPTLQAGMSSLAIAKESLEGVSEIPQVNRLKTSQEIIKSLELEYRANFKNLKTDQERLEYTRKYLEMIKRVPTALGLEKSGRLNIVDSEVSKKQIENYKNLKTSALQYGIEQQALLEGKLKQAKATEDLAKEEEKYNKNVDIAVGKLIRYRVAFYTMRGAIEGVITSLKDFTKTQYQLADLQRVMDRQTDSIVLYKQEALTLAREFGVSIEGVVQSMKVWAQAGLRQNEVLEVTKATLVGVAALGMTTQEVTEALTAAIFTYGIAVEDVTNVISKWLSVEKQFPVSAQDLANSLKIVGASAQIVGVDLDDLMGYIAAINASTRKSGVAIGQSLKTMFGNLPRQEVIQSFEGLNIAVLKNATEFRDLDDILDDLYGKWDQLSSVQKTNLGVTLDGVRRFSDFVALMDNYPQKMKAIIESHKATNEAQQASTLMLGTLQKQWESFNATVDQFKISVGQIILGPLGDLLSGFSSLVNWLNKSIAVVPRLTASLISFGSVLATLYISSVAVSFIWNKLGKEVISLGAQIKSTQIKTAGFEESAKRAAIATTALGRAGNFASAMFKSLGGVMGVITLISVAASIYTMFAKSASDASSAVDTLSNSNESSLSTIKEQIKAYEQENVLLKNIPKKLREINAARLNTKSDPQAINYYKELLNQLELLPKESQEVQRAFNDVIQVTGDASKSIDFLSNTIDSYINKNNELIKSLQVQYKAQKDLVFLEQTQIQQNAQNMIIQLDNVKDKFNEFEGLKIPKIDVHSILDANSLQYIQKGASNIVSTLRNGILKAIESGDTDALNKSVNVFVDDLERSFAGLDQKEMGSLNIAKLWRTLFNIDIPYDVMAKLKDYNDLVKSLPEELQGSLIISNKNINDSFVNLRQSIENAVNQFGKENFGKKMKGFEQLQLEKLITDQMNLYISSINNAIDVQTKFARIYAKYNLDLATSKVLLEQLGKEQDKNTGKFELGQAPASDVVNLIKSIKDLSKSFDQVGDRAEDAKKFLNFGEFFREEAFTADEAKKFLSEYVKKYREIGYVITENEVKQGQLEKAIKKVENQTKDFSSEQKTAFKGSYELLSEYDRLIDLVGKADITNELRKGLQETESSLKFLRDAQSKVFGRDTYAKALVILDRYNDRLKDIFVTSQDIDFLIKNVNSYYDMSVSVLKSFVNKQEKIFSLEKERLTLVRDLELKQADISDEAGKQAKKEAIIKKYTESYTDLLQKEANYKIVKILTQAVENSQVLKESLSEAFTNIPDTIMSGAEKRRDLSNELRDAEYELQNARSEGDAQSIFDAQERIRLVKEEMKEYKRGWYEVKKVIFDIFANISSNWWKKLSDNLAESLANITIGGKTLADSIESAITTSTTKFTTGWEDASRKVLSEYSAFIEQVVENSKRMILDIYGIIDAKNIDFGNEINKISNNIKAWRPEPNTYNQSAGPSYPITDESFGNYTVTLDDSNSLKLKDIADNTKTTANNTAASKEEKAKEYSDLAQSIRGALTMIGVALGTGITGTKSKEAGIGAQTGGMVGAAAGTEYLTGALGLFAGPVGGFLGSIAGGLIGGLFGGDNSPKRFNQALDANTEATMQNTIALKELDKSIFNAPTNYNIPAYSGAFGGNITININSNSNPRDIANQVKNTMEDLFRTESRRYGTRGYASI